MHGHPGKPFAATKLFVAANRGVSLALLGWFLSGAGYLATNHWWGLDWRAGDAGRRAILLGFAAFYFLRVLFTLFSLLKRRMGWSEAVTIAVFLYVVDFVLVVLGGRSCAPLGTWDAAGTALFALGSALTSGSEWMRMRWKARPENRGELYTGGLFSLARHINYFGEVVSFSGFALVSRFSWAWLIPFGMLLGFVFFNIPELDRYLLQRYGAAFAQYAARTKKLIPFVY